MAVFWRLGSAVSYRKEREGAKGAKEMGMPDELEPTIYDGRTVIPDELNALSRLAIGACIAVHKELGAGLPEQAYANALALELDARGIEFEREKSVEIRYRGKLVGRCRLDFLIGRRLLLETKAVKALTDLDRSQVITYLRLTKQPLGLLISFNVPILKSGIKRVLCSD